MAGDDGIALKYEGDKEVLASINRLTIKGDRISLFEKIGAYGRSSTQQRFNTGSGPDGKPWPKSLRVKIFGGKTLVDRGLLQSSLTYNKTEHSSEWGSPMIYAPIQHFGGTVTAKNKGALAFRLATGAFVKVKSVTIPAHPFLGVNAKDEKRIGKICMDFLSRRFK